MKKSESISNTLAAILVLYLFYYSYRYILQYNSEITSPTYSNTPAAISLLKYVFLAVLLAVLFFRLTSERIAPKPLALCAGLLVLQNLYALLTTKNTACAAALGCLMPLFLLLLVPVPLNEAPFDRALTVFLNFTVAYEFLQILLYAAAGRLPALGYPTGKLTDVRFGGPWDDPNGFAVFLSFLLPYSCYKYRGAKRAFYALSLSVFLALTWSMTGIACFAAVLLFLGALRLSETRVTRKKLFVFVLVCLLLAVGAIAGYLLFREKIDYFFQSKAGSFYGHLQGFRYDLSFGALLGLTPSPENPESSVMSLLLHGGVLHLFLFYALAAAGVLFAYRRARSTEKGDRFYPLRRAILCYQIAFTLSTLNLPFVYSFSCFGCFTVFLILSARCAVPSPLPSGAGGKMLCVRGGRLG